MSARTSTYVPHRGDIVHLNLNNTAGHEMDGPHFALVISRHIYNFKAGLAVILVGSSKPVKNPARKPFALPLPGGLITTAKNPEGKGEIRCDETRTIDYSERGASFVTRVDDEFVNRAIDLMLAVYDEEEGGD